MTSFGGLGLDAEIQASNMNFFKATEGFLESLPQATIQLSYVLRTPFTSDSPSKFGVRYNFYLCYEFCNKMLRRYDILLKCI